MDDKLRVETSWINLVDGVSQEEAPGLGQLGPRFRLPIGPDMGIIYIMVESLRGPQPEVERQMVDAIAEAYRRAPAGSITGALRQALTVANRQLYQANQAALSDQKIAVGTTCVVLRGADLFLAQVGPALAYMVHRGTLQRIPTDSPWLSPARAPTPISAPLGVLLETDPLLVHFFLEPGDLLVLCSSVLVRYAAEGEIRAAVTQGDGQTVVQALEQLARGRDLVALAIAATSAEAEAVPVSEVAPPGQGWQNVLREAILYSPVEAPSWKIWRKHWWKLLEAIITPWALLVVVTALSGMVVASELWPRALWLLIPAFLAGLFWLAWQVVDWYNDIHVVTDDRIIEIEKKPFLWEVRREAPLTNIKDVRYIIPNQIARILGFGNVEIETVGQAGVFTFEAVPNPKSVQTEILNQLDRPRVGRADRAARVELARLDLLRLETLREIGLVREKLAWMPADQAALPGDTPEALRRLGDTPEALRRLEAVGTEVAAALAPVSRRVRDGHLAAARRGLDDFRRFAAVGRGTQPFIEVAEHWRGILERQAAQLQAIPNPFVAGPPLTAGSPLFVGREDVLREIADYLAAGRGTAADKEAKSALVLYGQRRMGKSSILLQLSVRLPEDYIPAYADLRGLAAQGTAGLLRGLAGVVAKAVVARGLTTPVVAPLEDFAPEPFATFNAFLDQVEVIIGTRRVALLLDEFEWLQEKVAGGPVSQDIFGYLASVIKNRPPFFLVFAGLHNLEQMRREYWTSFLYGNSVPVPVSYLSQAEAERLLAMLPLETPPQVRRHICRATGCQPYLLQVVCYRLVEHLNAKEPPPEQSSVRDVVAVLDLIMEEGEAEPYFQDYVWRHSTPTEQAALVALARPGGEQRGQPLQEEALRSLERREILIQQDGTWRYRVELVRRWVARKAREVTTTEV